MRPSILDPLFARVTALPGIGPRLAPLFNRLLGEPGRSARVVDLLLHLPHATLDRRYRPTIAAARCDQLVTLEVTVAAHRPPPRRHSKVPYKVLVEDGTGDVQLVFFLGNRAWIEKSLPLRAQRWVSGRLDLRDGRLQMIHPDRILDATSFAKMPAVEPVYGLTVGLSQRIVVQAAAAALARLPGLPEWLDAPFVTARALPTFGGALAALHRPQRPESIEPTSPAAVRLAYDELLAHQLALLMVRANMRQHGGRARVGDGGLTSSVEAALPFRLTPAQRRALDEIHADLAQPTRMLRLLHGDVGSGKTVVALLAMVRVVEQGGQAAMMAPTEILARQHYRSIEPFAAAAGLRAALFTGRDKPGDRMEMQERLTAGHIDIAVGTHALFQDDLVFHDLALAVVDEQHRFGVHQRLALGRKGRAVDILVMTATPIPRTLVLTYFGDMDVSTLHEKPAGRQPIETRAVPFERLANVIGGVGRAMQTGARAYWVCPLVEENRDFDLAAAEQRYQDLRRSFGSVVGLVHGQMSGRDKDLAMEKFQRGDTKILVATTVIEVGVDVPEATIMVIEHAERFGLAQLHQLRGRVGRGSGKSTCVLVYKPPLGQIAMARLEIMRATEDGFRIAEEDLHLRGEGELLGTRQSGTPGFRLARLDVHGSLLAVARDDARLVLAGDPQLETDRGRALRVLLYLFERDAAVRLLRAG